MFEEMYRDSGFIRIPTGEYIDGKPNYTPAPMTYFSFEGTYRHPQTGELQSENTYMIKAATLNDIPSDAQIVDAAGKVYDIKKAVKKKNFDGKIECFKVVVA